MSYPVLCREIKVIMLTTNWKSIKIRFLEHHCLILFGSILKKILLTI